MGDVNHYHQAISMLRIFFKEQQGFLDLPQNAVPHLKLEPVTPSDFEGSASSIDQCLLKDPGVFSIMNEETTFNAKRGSPRLEFALNGDFEKYHELQRALLQYLGFPDPVHANYDVICQVYSTDLLGSEHYKKMHDTLGRPLSLDFFPERLSPHWSIKHDTDGLYCRSDLMIEGKRIISTIEREPDASLMEKRFNEQMAEAVPLDHAPTFPKIARCVGMLDIGSLALLIRHSAPATFSAELC